jgi:hypothetical protein
MLAAGTAAAQSPLDRLAWLGGCWEASAEGRVTIEMWMPPAGGLMVGASRTVANGRARAYEHLRLHIDGEQLVYTAIPSGQTETAFRSTALGDSGFTVENPQHDFPQRITYHRTGQDTMTARVEGPGPNGPRGFEVRYRRVQCGGDPD